MMRRLLFKLFSQITRIRYRMKGFVYSRGAYVSAHQVVKIGGGKIFLAPHAQINASCYFLSADDIYIGQNTAVAYRVTFLTSANPNYPHNSLSTIYRPMHAPIKIGADCWIGANSTILPGVTVGDRSVIAAGSVVTRDVPPGVMVAGNPAKIKKVIQCKNS